MSVKFCESLKNSVCSSGEVADTKVGRTNGQMKGMAQT